jgi:4-hydroxybenzoate polyprenyltransferase
LAETPLLVGAGLAFLAFSLCASGIYVLNDLLDLDSDRQHPAKKSRPFATGDLPLGVGLAIVPVLMAAGGLIAATVCWGLAGVLAAYVLLTSAYSWWLRRVALLDVFTLAALYVFRLWAGQVSTGVILSFWLVVFALFIFLSLALVKRFVELKTLNPETDANVRGRGYLPGDLDLVATLGSSCGFMAVLVLALYVNSPEVRLLYPRPEVLLFGCPILLFWVSRVWLVAHRGRMHDDPIVFALRDWVSLLLGLLLLAVLWLAARS